MGENMGFENVTIDQAMQEYEGKLDAMGLLDPQKSLLMDAMRAQMEGLDRSLAEYVGLFTPAVATGELLDRWLDHEWRGPMGTETMPPEDEPRDTSVRDAVQKNW
jgi:hypothetical protein